MQKKTKIIIAVVCAVVVAAGVALGLYFGLKDKPVETVFATTGTVDVFDANTLKFSYTTPFIEEGSFEIADKKAFEVTTDDKTISGKIISVEYRPTDSETVQTGELVITADLSEKLVAGTSYRAVVKAGAVEHKKEEYVNPDITADFKTREDDNGVLHADEITFKDAKAVVLSNVEPELYQKDGKAYFSITAKADGLTKYNEEASKNFKVYAGYSYKNSDGRFVRWLNTDVVFSAENGVIKITGAALADDRIPGTDYNLVISKGFVTNDDKTIVNEEYTTTFTYVEK